MSEKKTVNPREKMCRVCGRRFAWRKKWERDWEHVKHCSAACRRRGPKPVDDALEDAIRELLTERARGASICPAEAARRVSPEAWRTLMEPTRAAARRLTHQGVVQMTQRGRAVDPDNVRGPFRMRLARG